LTLDPDLVAPELRFSFILRPKAVTMAVRDRLAMITRPIRADDKRFDHGRLVGVDSETWWSVNPKRDKTPGSICVRRASLCPVTARISGARPDQINRWGSTGQSMTGRCRATIHEWIHDRSDCCSSRSNAGVFDQECLY